MSWKEGFYTALLKFLREQLRKYDAAGVTDFRSVTEQRGYCETCEYSVTVIEIRYRTEDGRSKTASWQGEFADLMTKLEEK